MITLYDIAAHESYGTWSPATWRTRYVLDYKRLPYKVVFIEYPNVASELKKLGIGPTATAADGSPIYTCPAIADDDHGVRLADSFPIAEYLDKTYPDTPKVLPPGTEALQKAFYDQFCATIISLGSPLWPLYVPRVPNFLNPAALEYYNRTRTITFGKPMNELEPKEGKERTEEWKKVEALFTTVDGWLSRGSGRYFGGDAPTFADICILAIFKGMRIGFGEDSEEWKNMRAWHGGRWKPLLDELDTYTVPR